MPKREKDPSFEEYRTHGWVIVSSVLTLLESHHAVMGQQNLFRDLSPYPDSQTAANLANRYHRDTQKRIGDLDPDNRDYMRGCNLTFETQFRYDEATFSRRATVIFTFASPPEAGVARTYEP